MWLVRDVLCRSELVAPDRQRAVFVMMNTLLFPSHSPLEPTQSSMDISQLASELQSNHNLIVQGDNLRILPHLANDSVQLIYIDPPFNTGTTKRKRQITTTRSPSGTRTGFSGKRYSEEVISSMSYGDRFDDYLAFLEPRLLEARRILSPTGLLYFHIDQREVHYCKILLDSLFGRDCFLNEIIWAYDYGGRSRQRWPAKHDSIPGYVKSLAEYHLDLAASDRLPYLAPSLVSREKAELGKLPTDVWWHTIVPTNSKEKTGYPTQKPLAILERIVRTSSQEEDTVLDFFAGSGTAGEAAARNGRRYIMIDSHPDAIAVMVKRLGRHHPTLIDCSTLTTSGNQM